MGHPLLKQPTSTESFYAYKDIYKTITITAKAVLCKAKAHYFWLTIQSADVDSTRVAMQ